MINKISASDFQRMFYSYFPLSKTTKLALGALGLFAAALCCARYYLVSRVSHPVPSKSFPEELIEVPKELIVSHPVPSKSFPEELIEVLGGADKVNQVSLIPANFFPSINFPTLNSSFVLQKIKRLIAQHGVLAPIMISGDAEGNQFIVFSRKGFSHEHELEQHIIYKVEFQDDIQWEYAKVTYRNDSPVPRTEDISSYTPKIHNELLHTFTRTPRLVSSQQAVVHWVPSDMGFPKEVIELMGGQKRFDTLPVVFELNQEAVQMIYVRNTIEEMCNSSSKAHIPPVSLGIDPWSNPFIRMRIFEKDSKRCWFLTIYAQDVSEHLQWYIGEDPLSPQHQYIKLIEKLITDTDLNYELA